MTTPSEIKFSSSFACNLTAIDIEHRDTHLITAKHLFSQVQEIQELPNGYSFRFPNDSATFLQTAKFVSNERQCCTFFHFNLELKPENGPFWLHLTGQEGTKQLLEAEFGAQFDLQFGELRG